jgi:hypothetical protein
MSDEKKNLPALTQGPHVPALPTTQLPVTPPTFTTAFMANLQMKVSAHLYKRMNEIASQHLQLHQTLHAIDRVRMDRESTLAEWDDLDNRLQHEQDGREHRRRLDRAKREDDLEEIEYRRRARRRQEEQEERQHAIAMQKLTTALDPSKAPTENNAAAQFRAMMKDVHALHEAGREEIDKLKSRADLSPAERDEEVFKVRAAMAQFAQHIASTGELPDDMRRQVMDAFNRA